MSAKKRLAKIVIILMILSITTLGFSTPSMAAITLIDPASPHNVIPPYAYIKDGRQTYTVTPGYFTNVVNVERSEKGDYYYYALKYNIAYTPGARSLGDALDLRGMEFIKSVVAATSYNASVSPLWARGPQNSGISGGQYSVNISAPPSVSYTFGSEYLNIKMLQDNIRMAQWQCFTSRTFDCSAFAPTIVFQVNKSVANRNNPTRLGTVQTDMYVRATKLNVTIDKKWNYVIRGFEDYYVQNGQIGANYRQDFNKQ